MWAAAQGAGLQPVQALVALLCGIKDDRLVTRTSFFTLRRHPGRDGAEPSAGIGDPRPASTQRRPAVMRCCDQRIPLDFADGGESRYSPSRIAADAMVGDPARRDRTVLAAVWGMPAASVAAPRSGWPW